jgi:hypothetical protein
MNRSETIKELATALSKAQGAIEGAIKDKTNPAFRSTYADLAAVWDACRTPLTSNGLSVVQFTIPTEANEVVVETTILHASGEWMSGTIAIPVDKNSAHGYGSALTYARRYALSAAVGIAPEDDDGNKAADNAPKARKYGDSEPPKGSARSVTEDAFNALDDAAKEVLERKVQSIVEANAAHGIVKAVDVLQDLKFGTEDKLAAWFLLDSELRSSIKREEIRRRTKSTEKEFENA